MMKTKKMVLDINNNSQKLIVNHKAKQMKYLILNKTRFYPFIRTRIYRKICFYNEV